MLVVNFPESRLTGEMGLWACLWEIILTALTKVGRAASHKASCSLEGDPGLCKWREWG